MRVEFNGLRFDLPQGWTDITEDLPSGAPPSLGRDTGVGAVQFSIARYRGGDEPRVSLENLRAFLAEFCRRNGMPSDKMKVRLGKTMSVGATSIAKGELISANYMSNGRDVVLATYVCSDPESSELEEDLRGVENILNSLEF